MSRQGRQKCPRAQTILEEVSTASDLDPDAMTDTAPPPKRKKPSVAQNAAAIDSLSARVLGVDDKLAGQSVQLTSIADMLSKLHCTKYHDMLHSIY